MNLSLVDPFVLSQDYPESTTASLRSGHTTFVRFNRKGDLLAAGRVDGTIVIFDVETYGVARKLKGHTRQIYSLSWSREGRYILSASQDWKCIIWDLRYGSVLRSVRFEAPVYIADFHPWNHLVFATAVYENAPQLVDATEPEAAKLDLPTVPERLPHERELTASEKQTTAKHVTTVVVFTASGEHILAGTVKGFLNIIEVSTRKIIYSNKLATGMITHLRLTNSGKDLVLNAGDRVIRTIQLPNLLVENLDPDTIDLEIEHRFADVVNRLSWNHVAFSSTGEYVTASTYNNHDIYIWERNHGSLVKILEGPKEEHGTVEWHPHRPLIAACGLESGRIHIWSIVPQQRWSALAPDFAEVEQNVEYLEREDEFDIYPQEELHKRRLGMEDEDVDVLRMEPTKEEVTKQETGFQMPVQLDYYDSEPEEEFVTVGRGEMRRKSPTAGREINLEDTAGSADEMAMKLNSKW